MVAIYMASSLALYERLLVPESKELGDVALKVYKLKKSC